MDKVLTEKIILLLLSGLALSFSRSSLQHYRIYKKLGKEWQRINRKKLQAGIQQLYRSKIIAEKRNEDGSFTFVLSNKGRLKSLTYHFENLKISKTTWDKKWRIVFFDIPEKYRWGRDSLRKKLRELGFYELQKSVFIFPYDCTNEIEFIVEYYNVRRYVRFAIVDYIDSSLHLENKFGLN